MVSPVQTDTQENPTINGGMQKWKLSWNMYTFSADLYAQSVLIF